MPHFVVMRRINRIYLIILYLARVVNLFSVFPLYAVRGKTRKAPEKNFKKREIKFFVLSE